MTEKMSSWMLENLNINVLVGKTIVKIEGMEKDSNEIIFTCSDGTKYIMYHEQECSEDVSINDVCGDPNDLIGSEILKAEESISECNCIDDSSTWTFYKLATIKGSVDLRWYGTSNGYYSESVDFKEYNKEEYIYN